MESLSHLSSLKFKDIGLVLNLKMLQRIERYTKRQGVDRVKPLTSVRIYSGFGLKEPDIRPGLEKSFGSVPEI